MSKLASEPTGMNNVTKAVIKWKTQEF